LVLGVDSSTQATKVEVRDADSGRLVADGRAPHPPASPPRSEQDPEAWLRALAEAMDIAGVDPVAVAAVAVAGQQHGLVVLDTDGRPLRPAKLWNDTESAPDAVALLDRLDGAGWARACGSVPVPAMTVTKLAWLRRVEPTAYERVASVLLPHDFVTRSLVGTAVTDQGDASGTGYWSPADRGWRHDLLALVDPERDWAPLLPRVLGPTEAAGSWRGALVGPGTGDNMAAALGLGLGPGDVAFSIGTSGTVFAVTETPTADPSGAVAGFADATGHYLPLVCTLNAAKVTDAAARLLGVDHAGLDALAEAAPAGAGGLVLVPYLDGERTPNRPLASGTLAGTVTGRPSRSARTRRYAADRAPPPMRKTRPGASTPAAAKASKPSSRPQTTPSNAALANCSRLTSLRMPARVPEASGRFGVRSPSR